MKRIGVSDDVFYRNPGYIRGIVQATSINNGPAAADLVALLRTTEAHIRSSIPADKIAEQPQIASWREAFRRFGAKPTEYRPSIEAITRRVLKGDQIPSISRVVDIGTIISLKLLAPVGAHATDVVSDGLELRLATGEELFVALGSDVNDSPSPGEIIFVDGNVVATRRWVWRQGNHTVVTNETRAVEFNVDGLPPVTYDDVAQACEEVRELGSRYCGGSWESAILTRGRPHIPLRE